ncbi:hypothetical protein NL676_000039 [Syzygium grande]|nr:hypothetical protein NL676_000039 [Syzygium grande]
MGHGGVRMPWPRRQQGTPIWIEAMPCGEFTPVTVVWASRRHDHQPNEKQQRQGQSNEGWSSRTWLFGLHTITMNKRGWKTRDSNIA